MKKNTIIKFGIVLIVLLVMIIGIISITSRSANIFRKDTASNTIDEVTGSWQAGGTTKDGYAWLVVYTFKNGHYDLKTESTFKDQGTYIIAQRFEDKSLKLTKTSETFKKTYDIYLAMDPNGTYMLVDGVKLMKK